MLASAFSDVVSASAKVKSAPPLVSSGFTHTIEKEFGNLELGSDVVLIQVNRIVPRLNLKKIRQRNSAEI